MFDPNENRYDESGNAYRQPPRRSGNSMSTAAFACGILGLFGIFTIYGGFIFGSLAILFAHLSRGKNTSPARIVKFSRILGILTIAISGAILISGLILIQTQYGGFENFMNEYLNLMQQYLGTDLPPEPTGGDFL